MSHRKWLWHPQFCHWMTQRDPDYRPSYPQWTVIGSVTTPHHLAVQFSPCFHQRTNVTDHCSHHILSCTTILVVRDPNPNCLSLFLSVLWRTSTTDRHYHDGPSCTTGILVRHPCPKGLQLFLSVLWRTSTTDRHYHNGMSCTTVMTVRDPCPKGLHFFSKCSMTDIYDGASYTRWSVLPNRHDGQRP